MTGFHARLLLEQVRDQMFGSAEPLRIGRYELREMLGSGAYGTVYRAYDPDLDRSVAVKILHRGVEESHRARLLREARALARLEHPNVLVVYEAAVEQGRLFIATEFVEGGTLATWLESSQPGTSARFDTLLGMAIAVARGLAAAHDAGVIHRDIKPANILLGSDLRPRLADFGLAQTPDAPATDDSGPSEDGQARPGESQGVVGTPLYMAPEQFAGQAGPAADQWSLCATLWEASYGAHPFPETSRASASGAGPWPRAPAIGHVPKRWRDALLRGLGPRVADRWPSVHALADEFKAIAGRRRRRRIALTVVPTAGLAVVLGGQQLHRWSEQRACRAEAEVIHETWNPAAADSLGAALGSVSGPHVDATVSRTRELLDDYASRWSASYEARCLASVDGHMTDAAWGASQTCLDLRAYEVRALLRILGTEPTAETVRLAIEAAAQLSPVDVCESEPFVDVERGSGRDETVATVRRLIDNRALRSAGRYREARERSVSLVTELESHADPRLRIEAELDAAAAHGAMDEVADAKARLESAFASSLEADQTDLAFRSATSLVKILGSKREEFDDGLLWSRIALALHGALGSPDNLGHADLLDARGDLYRSMGRFEDAEADFLASLAIRERILGPEHPHTITTRTGFAAIAAARGDYEEALERAVAVLRLAEQSYGPRHPRVGAHLRDLGRIHTMRRKLDDAAEALHAGADADRPRGQLRDPRRALAGPALLRAGTGGVGRLGGPRPHRGGGGQDGLGNRAVVARSPRGRGATASRGQVDDGGDPRPRAPGRRGGRVQPGQRAAR